MTNIRKSVYRYDYRRSADQNAAAVVRRPVVVVGAGPVGLAAAIDLAQRGVPVVLMDDADRIGEGSRGICWSKRTLEILDRLGIGERLVAQGVTWKLGKVFVGDELLYSFDLLPEEGHKMPAFINLQQFYLEKTLVDRALELNNLDLRWKNRLVGLDFAGVTFEDKFLIADVHMAAEFPTERRFWFAPTFHSGQSALMHRQPDDIWRIDLQLGPDADPVAEQAPERVRARLDKVLKDHPYELEWVSVYTFNCRRLDRFVHGRVIFIGDAAHQVSPFGARGANSGLEDAENLAWKLDRVLRGKSPERLLESYHVERSGAANENIRESTRSTDFMAPNSRHEARLRKAVLSLARDTEFGKRMVNAGRLSVPSVYQSPLSTADSDSWRGGPPPGASMLDAPLATRAGERMFLSDAFVQQGTRFALIAFANGAALEVPGEVGTIQIGGDDGFADCEGLAGARYDAEPGTAYLLRPDGYVAARFRHPTRGLLEAALARASGVADLTFASPA